MARRLLVEQIVDDGLCVGCGACALLAPPGAVQLGVGSTGFVEPAAEPGALDRSAAEALARCCPGARVAGPSRRDDVLWGPILEAQAGWATDPAVRHAASSGGVLTALCRHLLASGTVDAVVTLGVDPVEPLRPRSIVARTVEQLHGTEGSRYCPSSPVAALADTRPGERVAFVGKPCDVVAVRQLAAVEPWVAERVAVALSFFCAGIPSFDGTDEVVRTLGHEPAAVTAFRYRGHGWPGRATAAVGDDERSMTYKETWSGILTRYRHERCKVCPDGTGELADLACGDAWEVVDDGPDFTERDGRSLVLARTEVGAEVLAAAQAAGALELGPYDVGVLETIQASQALRKRAVAARVAGRTAMGAASPRLRRLGLLRAARGLGWRSLLAEARGAAWRARRDHPRRWHRALFR